jgi:hypothetical protein
MASTKRNEANRQNAQKSTGPKTAEGKAVVSQNAIRHGLLATETLLPDEDTVIFDDFHQRLSNDLKPVGGLEELLIDRIVSSAWRLNRLMRIEVSMLRGEIEGIQQEQEQKDEDPPWLLTVNKRPSTSHPLGLAFRHREDTVTKMSRYETALERALYRALHELQRIQATRNGASVPLPAAIDIDVAVAGQVDGHGFVS